MVVLPTGLGKTFIAAVVMYNIYRWFPKGKIIFMAPTRPLVAQQISACYNIMGIKHEDTIEITGKLKKQDRYEHWKNKRVFFATPQAVQSDLVSKDFEFPISDIRLVVVDEAHKAKGKYAFVEVIRMISERNKTFRVLALTATPGRTLKDVREVVQNLLISHIETRFENSIDVAPYTFTKNIKKEIVKFDIRLKRIRDRLLNIMEPYVATLKASNLLTGCVGTHSKGFIIMKQKDFQQLAAIQRPPNYSELSSAFSVCVSLYFSLDVLERHGVRMFMNSLLDTSNKSGLKYIVLQNKILMQLVEEIKADLKCESYALDQSLNRSAREDPNFDFGHPKFKILEQKLNDHFNDTPDSKAMIFCELRETVYLIDILLSKHKPLIRAKKIVGQGSSSGIKAVTQKEQLAVMKEFKEGVINCLVATCVAEEGIDIGDVTLIVCFDSNTNPTRYIQRIGRTGRKQKGNVLMLLSEGQEYESYKKVVNNKNKTTDKICNNKEVEWFLYKNSPRLIPTNPELMEVCFEVKPPDNPTTTSNKATKTKKVVKPREPQEQPNKKVSIIMKHIFFSFFQLMSFSSTDK